jgi:hypothetical protein
LHGKIHVMLFRHVGCRYSKAILPFRAVLLLPFRAALLPSNF